METDLTAIQNLSIQAMADAKPETFALLKAEISRLPTADVQRFQRCLLIPCIRALKGPPAGSRSRLESAFDVLREILTRSKLESWPQFRDLLGTLCVLLKNQAEIKGAEAARDEVFVEDLLRTFSDVLRACDAAAFLAGLQQARSHIELLWGHMIFGCVQCLQQYESRSAKVAALVLLEELVLIFPVEGEQRKFAGGLFATVLPGVGAACSAVLTGSRSASPVVGSTVVAQTLRTLAAYIGIILEDSQNVFIAKPSSSAKAADVNGISGPETSDIRNQKWLDDTLPKLAVIFGHVHPFCTSESEAVRKAVLHFCWGIVRFCSRSLRPTLVALVRDVVLLAEDDIDGVRFEAEQVLSEMEKFIHDDERDWMMDGCREDFLRIMDLLPMVARNESAESLVSHLRACSGYLRLLQSSLPAFLAFGNSCERILTSLTAVIEIDEGLFDFMGLSMEVSDNAFENGPYRLKYAGEPAALRCCFKILDTLYCGTSKTEALTFLLDRLHKNDDDNENETLLLSNMALSRIGQGHRLDPASEELISEILQIYISMDVWNYTNSAQAAVLSKRCLPANHSFQADDLSFGDLKHRLLRLCLVIQGIGIISKVYRTGFIRHLHTVLYIILEKSEAEFPVVKSCARQALKSIAESCGYGSVSDLVSANCEYVINSITIKLRHLYRYPKAILVVKALMDHCSPDNTLLLLKLVRSVMDKLDEYHDVAALPFVVVLGAVVRRLSSWFPPPEKAKAIEQDKVAAGVEYLKSGYFGKSGDSDQTERASGESGYVSTETDEEPVEASEILEETTEKSVPQYVQVVSEVSKRCAYILPVDNRDLRVALLDVICDACGVLAGFKDEFLPVVHKIWQSIIMLHRGSDYIVVRKAFRCVCVMAEWAGSFLRYRITKEMIPYIARFLGTEAQKSLKFARDDFAPVRQLQISLLRDLPSLLHSIEAEDTTAEILASAVIWYLDCRQPEPLRTSAELFFIELARLQPDIVQVKMMEMDKHGTADKVSEKSPGVLNPSQESITRIRTSLRPF